jgi:hypothetical protein
MPEKDKMLAGELYDANYDKELIKDRYKANEFGNFYKTGSDII